jgi:hypothetical protein
MITDFKQIDSLTPSDFEIFVKEVFEAMKQVAQTGKGPLEQIQSMGCSIKWKE